MLACQGRYVLENYEMIFVYALFFIPDHNDLHVYLYAYLYLCRVCPYKYVYVYIETVLCVCIFLSIHKIMRKYKHDYIHNPVCENKVNISSYFVQFFFCFIELRQNIWQYMTNVSSLCINIFGITDCIFWERLRKTETETEKILIMQFYCHSHVDCSSSIISNGFEVG